MARLAAGEPAEGWEVRRRRLNHDELRNRHILAARRMLAIMEGDVVDEEFRRRFEDAHLAMIDSALAQAADLVCECVAATSPARLFEARPLAGCDAETRSWLEPLVVASWKQRQDVDRRVEEAQRALRAASEGRERVRAASGLGVGAGDPQLKEAVIELCQGLGRLADALGDLPSGPLPC